MIETSLALVTLEALLGVFPFGRASLLLFAVESQILQNRGTEFSKCYAGATRPEDCIAAKEDYMECLHHTKEVP